MHLEQRFPTFIHLRNPWQPISINCTLHINQIFVINIVAVFLKFMLTYLSSSAIIQFLFRVPLNVLLRTPGVRVPQIGNH